MNRLRPMQRPASFTRPALASLMVLVCLALGCSTHAKRLATPRSLFYDGRLEECRTSLVKLEKSRHDKDVVNLDLAIVDLLSGKPKEAENATESGTRSIRRTRVNLPDRENGFDVDGRSSSFLRWGGL